MWAIYLVATITVFAGSWQWRRQFKQGKKAIVFDELSKEVQEAADLVNEINDQMSGVIDALAAAANQASSSPAVSPQDVAAEIDRRLKDLGVISDKQRVLLDTSYDSFKRVLLLIRKVEMSTIVSKDSRKTARHLFYLVQDQFDLIKAAIDVLISMNVTPPVGQALQITPKTFNAVIALLNSINTGNPTIVGYLDDLGVVLHNDLVKGLYRSAKFASKPMKHLGPKGLIDNRTNTSLI